MIANAGIAVIKPLLESESIVDIAVWNRHLSCLSTASTEEWDRIMAINVRSVMLCYKYAGEQMIRQGRGGRIIGRFVLAVASISD